MLALTGQFQETISPEEFENMDAEVQAALALFVNMSPSTGYKNELHEDPMVHAAIMLSMAEEAIAKATGDSPGQSMPRQCWGCFGLSHYESTPPHLFSSCPHKGDPEIQTWVRQKIEEFSRT